MPNEPILVAQSKEEIFLLPKMANRHGLIAGATGTGKITRWSSTNANDWGQDLTLRWLGI